MDAGASTITMSGGSRGPRGAAGQSQRRAAMMRSSCLLVSTFAATVLLVSGAGANTVTQNTSWTIDRPGTSTTYRVTAYGDSIYAGYYGSISRVAKRAAPWADGEYLSQLWNADIQVIRRAKSGAVASDIYNNKIVAERSYMQTTNTRVVSFRMCGNDGLQGRRLRLERRRADRLGRPALRSGRVRGRLREPARGDAPIDHPRCQRASGEPEHELRLHPVRQYPSDLHRIDDLRRLLRRNRHGLGPPGLQRRSDLRRQEPDLEPARSRAHGLGALRLQSRDALAGGAPQGRKRRSSRTGTPP